MFSIDFPEIVIILAVALVVLGPKKLPGAAAKIGRWVGRARTMARQFREQLETEISSAENAADIRKTIDSAAAPARKPAATGATAATQPDGAQPETAHRETVPHEAVAYGTSVHEASYESGPYEMPPPEGYGPPPQQLSFDEQLHDTALAPEGGAPASAPQAGRGAAAAAGSHPADMREWMPETQTWMASAGWESPEPAREPPASTPRPAQAQRPSPDRAPEPEPATPSSHTKAVEHDDR